MPLYKDRDGFIRRTPDEPQGWITKGFTRRCSMHKLSPAQVIAVDWIHSGMHGWWAGVEDQFYWVRLIEYA